MLLGGRQMERLLQKTIVVLLLAAGCFCARATVGTRMKSRIVAGKRIMVR